LCENTSDATWLSGRTSAQSLIEQAVTSLANDSAGAVESQRDFGWLALI
jgi:hypothetical protein